MVTNNPSTPAATDRDPALMAAWRRLLDYDQVSSGQKKSYQRIRTWVIILVLLSSAFAVFTTYTDANNTLHGLLRLGLVIMPIVSVALMNYGSEFATSTGWIEYRVGAEMLRSQIYVYRMGLRIGPFSDEDPVKRQQVLVEQINAADERIALENASLPYMHNIETAEIIKGINTTTAKDDDGFRPLNVDNYIEWRIRGQMRWYVGRIREDYRQIRRVRLLALVFAGVGAVLAAIGYGIEGLVAVTSAIGVSLTMFASVRMYGATYGIFHVTASRLQNELDRWEILPKDRRTPGDVVGLVTRVERILKEESDRWRQQTIQMQRSSEESIYKNMQQLVRTLKDDTVRLNTTELERQLVADWPLQPAADKADGKPPADDLLQSEDGAVNGHVQGGDGQAAAETVDDKPGALG